MATIMFFGVIAKLIMELQAELVRKVLGFRSIGERDGRARISVRGLARASSALASAQASNGRSPHHLTLLLPHQGKAKSSLTSDTVYTASINISRHVPHTQPHPPNNLFSALVGFPHWWDFSTSSPSFLNIVPKQWRRNIDCCFPFTLTRNGLAAYATSVSGVQLSELLVLDHVSPTSECTSRLTLGEGATGFVEGVSCFSTNGG